MGLFYYLLSNKRLLLLLFAIPLLFLSVLGPSEKKVLHILYNFDLSSLKNLYFNSDTFFRTPSTPLRFLLFNIGMIFIVFIPITSLSAIKYQNKDFHLFAKYLVVLFMFTILSTSNLYNMVALALLFLSIIYLLYYSSKDFNRIEGYFLSSYLLLSYYPFLHSFYIDTNISEIDNYLRFLFAIPIYCLIREIKIKEEHFKFIVNHASLVIGISAIYFYAYDSSSRISGYTSTATVFGNIALLFSCLSLLSIKNFKSNQFKYYPLFTAALAFNAWSLTGARSSLLILPIFLFIFVFSKDLRTNFFVKIDFKYIAIFVILITAIFSQSSAYNRTINSYETTYAYLFEKGEFNWNHQDSLIPRLTIWQGSANIIAEHPLTGVGQSNFNKHLVLQIKEEKIEPIRNDPRMLAAGLNHAHNQYLDVFAKTGIIGLVMLLFFLFMNLLFFLKKYAINKECFFSKSGIFMIITYSTYMLNHTIISHQQSSLFLSFFLIILAGLSNYNHLKVNQS